MSLASRLPPYRLVMFRVDLRKLGPLRRQIVELENCLDGTYRNASSAIDAFLRIYVELSCRLEIRFVFSGMNAVHWTGVHAGGILHSDTGLGNNVSHEFKRSPFCKRRQQPPDGRDTREALFARRQRVFWRWRREVH